MLDSIGYNDNSILYKRFLENSCGTGNILQEAISRYIRVCKKNGMPNEEIIYELSNNFVGFEIDSKLIKQCRNNLDKVALGFGFKNINWDLRNEDYLRAKTIEKFDYVVGNPPYYMYQDISITDRKFIKDHFESCQTGKFDYCYPFIEKSIMSLNEIDGVLCYLIPTSIFKNVYAENLRAILKTKLTHIIDFKTIRVFEDATVASSIIIVSNRENSKDIIYKDISSQEEVVINKRDLIGKWIFSNVQMDIINNRTRRFGDFFKVSNSVATLLNEAFVIKEIDEVNQNFVITKGELIESDSLRPAASPRALSTDKIEKIIFPYFYENDALCKYTEDEYRNKFPNTYQYLLNRQLGLLNRNSDISAKWFEYGRSQALNSLNQEKIILSSVLTDDIKPYLLDASTVPYSGFYITKISELSLNDAMDILHSTDLLNYLKVRGINANGNSLRFSVRDFENYYF